jgi:hypothetical protein
LELKIAAGNFAATEEKSPAAYCAVARLRGCAVARLRGCAVARLLSGETLIVTNPAIKVEMNL